MKGWRKKKAVARRYDATAGMYDLRYAEEQAPKYEIALSSIHDRGFGIVLDAGCGTGLFFDSIVDKSEVVCGLDISRRSILLAKKRAKQLSNVEVVCADVDFMPFRKGTFSHAFAFTVLQNVPQPDHTLEELKRVAEDNGQITVTGLKKVISKQAFLTFLKNARLDIQSLTDESRLKCYVAVCAKLHR